MCNRRCSCLDLAVEHANVRTQFGQPLMAFQNTQFKSGACQSPHSLSSTCGSFGAARHITSRPHNIPGGMVAWLRRHAHQHPLSGTA
jgi:hypothetical protein